MEWRMPDSRLWPGWGRPMVAGLGVPRERRMLEGVRPGAVAFRQRPVTMPTAPRFKLVVTRNALHPVLGAPNAAIIRQRMVDYVGRGAPPALP